MQEKKMFSLTSATCCSYIIIIITYIGGTRLLFDVFGILTLATRTYYNNNIPTTNVTRHCEHTIMLIRDAYKHALISSYTESVRMLH